MMAETYAEAVQLEGTELDHMRKLVRTAQDHLREVAGLTLGKLRKTGRIKTVRFILDNIRIVVEDEFGCGVYEDPPGICRPCRPGE